MVKKPKPASGKEGAPRWTYVAGAVVAVVGLAWGIVSYFIPKPEPLRQGAAASNATVTVSGSGNAGVGTMSGGQIAVGSPATQAASPASAPSKLGSTP